MTWLGDLAFRLTTRRMRPVEMLRAGLDDLAHRPVRVAGPRWFTAWGNDRPRLRRLDTVLLPAPWIGLEEDEMRAIAAAQIQGLNDDSPSPAQSPDLWTARRKLREAASRIV